MRQAVLSGGVTWDASGQSNLAGNAGKVTLDFAGKHLLQKVTASDGVKLVQRPAQASAQAHAVEISAATVDFLVNNGRTLQQAITSGPAQVAVLPAGDAQRTVATAGHFEAAFDRQNRLNQVVGMPDAKVVASDPGQPDKTSTSQRLEVAFSPNGGIASLVQVGDFHFEEGQRTTATTAGGRSAWAEQARYTPSDQILLLTGAPRIVEGGMTTTAQRVQFNRRTGDASADGDVKTTYSELKPQAGGALLATSDPIHVTAKVMNARQTGGTAVYSGGARLWQGSSIVQAPTLEFDRGRRTLLARGGPGEHVSTVFVQQDKHGKLTPVNLEAASLSYSDMQRTAHFEGGVVAKTGDMTLTADKVDVMLQAKGQTAVPPTTSTPSQVERIVADGHVNVQEPNRKAVGDQLVYTANDGRFQLTGGPPSIFDAERGKITGDSLTFFSHDDRVLVESKGTSPTVTQTRVAK